MSFFLFRQAVILAVYCFGCVTVMARTFNAEENTPTPDALIAYLPLMPAMQVNARSILDDSSTQSLTNELYIFLLYWQTHSSSFTLHGFVSEKRQLILLGMTKTILMSENLCNPTLRYSNAFLFSQLWLNMRCFNPTIIYNAWHKKKLEFTEVEGTL